MSIEEILYEKEFDVISDGLKEKLISLNKNLVGKNEMERMKFLVDFYNNNLKNIKLREEEEKAMFIAITNSLNEKDKKQFESMYKILLKHKNI